MADRPIVLHSHGMDWTGRGALRNQRASLRERLEIARQCREGAEAIAESYPIAARLLQQEAQRWLV